MSIAPARATDPSVFPRTICRWPCQCLLRFRFASAHSHTSALLTLPHPLYIRSTSAAQVSTTCDRYPPEYLAAKERAGEAFFTLPDGRKICYFSDGEGVPMICFHGGCEGKFMFLQKTPIPGVRMISVDRCGYGGSDSTRDSTDRPRPMHKYTWDDVGVTCVCTPSVSLSLSRSSL